jgi:hypothetical protein
VGWRLPAWQLTGSALLLGLEVVLAAVPEDQPRWWSPHS